MLKVTLQALRKINLSINPAASAFGRNWTMFPAKEYSSSLIFKELTSDKPVMIARLGSTELACLVNCMAVKNPDQFRSIKGFINGKTPKWWWDKKIMEQMHNWSGFFPSTESNIGKFYDMMLADMPKVDVLGSWLKEEEFFKKELSPAKKVMLEDLEPFFTINPWTKALEGKKVLVVHPFADTIQMQYAVRNKLFDNGLLPDFELITIKAVQSIAKEETRFKDWFEALDHMKEQIASIDFDICILGCGAYGFPLAAYVKEMGKKAFHLGGITQLLFGIKGGRWDQYIVYPYANLYNNYWVKPGDKERPKNAGIVEGATYW
ncbi:MAG: hypothetical protein ABJB86_20440 [Bacteroidota bacterium]